MTPLEYEKARNELIELLEEAAGLDSLSPTARDTIDRLRKKALEDQFHIVLAGEFQGGKSTTFNALCDGRHLSPVGSGIKTSGCVVSAANIAEDGEPESATVVWRSEGELVDGFSEVLLPRLQELAPARFGDTDPSQLRDRLNPDDEHDRKLIADAIKSQWRVLEKNGSARGVANLDALRCAGIVAHFHDHPLLRQLREKKQFGPDEIGRMIVFPDDWEQRWLEKNPGAFDVREVLFVFIRGVEVRIHSPNLGRLGCVLVDCPGLFAGRWDTEIARKAMIDADAILYLFDGSRALKQSDLDTLSFIRKNGMEYKLFYGCNVRGLSWQNGLRVFSFSMEGLRERGYAAGDNECVMFHALLALRAAQARRFIDGLPLFEGQGDAPFQQVEKILYDDISRCLSILGESENFRRLDKESVEAARKTAGLNQLMNLVEETAIGKKARSILIDNGSRIGVECLLEVEANLRSRELSAFRKESEFQRHSTEAENELGKFESNCKTIIAKLEDRTPDDLLADDFWDRLTSKKRQLCEKSAERIYREVLNLKNVPALLIGKERLNRLISSVVKSDLDESLREAAGGWSAEVRDGKNPVYNRFVAGLIRSVNRELKSAWDRSSLSDMELTSGISIPEFSGDLQFDDARIFRELADSQVLENIRSHAFLAAGSLTGVFTATSGVFVAIFALATRIFWVVIASAAVIVVNLLLLLLTRGLTEKTLKEEIRLKLSPAYDALFGQMETEVKEKFREFPACVREIYREAFLAASGKPRKIYQARKAQVEADLARSREERKQIAEHARKIRQTRIEPLRVRLDRFASETEACLSDRG